MHILYIPGLGDSYDGFRRFAMKLWSLHPGVHAEVVSMNWSDTRETYAEKCARIDTAIARIGEDRLVLVGESAGGSMALGAFARLPAGVCSLVTICGKNHGEHTVSKRLYRNNPAFQDSVHHADMALATLDQVRRRDISVLYSPFDQVVRPVDTHIEGAREYTLPTFGHLFSILIVLLFRARLVRNVAS